MIPTDVPSVANSRAGSSRIVRWTTGVLAGLLALAVTVGVSELVAAGVGPTSTPAVAVGERAVDLAPGWAKDFAIRNFGSHDKQVLLLGIFAVLALLAAVVGALSTQRVSFGVIAIAVLALVGAVAALSRPASDWLDALPSLVGGLAGAATLWLLLTPTRISAPAADSFGRAEPASYGRRRFLQLGSASLVVAGASATLGKTLLSHLYSAAASRNAVRIPAPASPAPVANGTSVGVAGAAPFMTPNSAFYRVDTALVVPQIDAETWSLRIHGMVDRELHITYADLLAMPLVERDITLTCVSNPIGGPYVGNARWVGVLLAPLLKKAGVHPDADQILSTSADSWTAGTPVTAVTDGRDAMLALQMNGEPLPFEHGFPVRMVVPGIYGYASATKWLVDLELTTFDKASYWVKRGYAEKAPIKTMSRIDVPKPFARVSAGTVAVAGVAWAQRKGIAKVEVRVDGGPWQEAILASQDTIDTWRQWVYHWQATSGLHTIEARAVDKKGYAQTQQRSAPEPDGATGWQSLVVTVL